MKWAKSDSLLQNYLAHFVFLKLGVNVFVGLFSPQFVINFFLQFLTFFLLATLMSKTTPVNSPRKCLKLSKKFITNLGQKFSRQKTLTPSFRKTACVKKYCFLQLT